MTQRQQYAVVQIGEPTAEQDRAAHEAWLPETANKISAVWQAMVKAAPPPPEQVLSEDDIDALFDEWHDSPEDINGLIRRAERAVLKQLGAKNV